MKRTYRASENLTEEQKADIVRELRLGYLNLNEGFFEQAKLNFLVATSLDKACADAFWGLMLCKFEIKNEDELLNNPLPHKNVIYSEEYKLARQNASKEQNEIFDSIMEGVVAVNASDRY